MQAPALIFGSLLLLMSGMAAAGQATKALEPKVTPLMTQALKDHPGKEVLMITVEYPPGGADPVHRHDAHGFIYVLLGPRLLHPRAERTTSIHRDPGNHHRDWCCGLN